MAASGRTGFRIRNLRGPTAGETWDLGAANLEGADFEYIVENHGPESTTMGKSTFNEEVNIVDSIRATVNKGQARPGRYGRIIYTYTFDTPQGVSQYGDPLYTVRVMVRPDVTSRRRRPALPLSWYVDPEDLTVFNEPQTQRLLAELQLRAREVEPQFQSLLLPVVDFVQRALDEHQTIALDGDA